MSLVSNFVWPVPSPWFVPIQVWYLVLHKYLALGLYETLTQGMCVWEHLEFWRDRDFILPYYWPFLSFLKLPSFLQPLPSDATPSAYLCWKQEKEIAFSPSSTAPACLHIPIVHIHRPLEMHLHLQAHIHIFTHTHSRGFEIWVFSFFFLYLSLRRLISSC